MNWRSLTKQLYQTPQFRSLSKIEYGNYGSQIREKNLCGELVLMHY